MKFMRVRADYRVSRSQACAPDSLLKTFPCMPKFPAATTPKRSGSMKAGGTTMAIATWPHRSLAPSAHHGMPVGHAGWVEARRFRGHHQQARQPQSVGLGDRCADRLHCLLETPRTGRAEMTDAVYHLEAVLAHANSPFARILTIAWFPAARRDPARTEPPRRSHRGIRSPGIRTSTVLSVSWGS